MSLNWHCSPSFQREIFLNFLVLILVLCSDILLSPLYALHSSIPQISDTSFSFSAWSPPLNVTPWVISLHCHSTLSPLLIFTHCSHPIKSDLPSGLLFQAVKSAKPETKQQNAALPSQREVMTCMFTLLHKLFGLSEEAPKKHVIFWQFWLLLHDVTWKQA